MNRAQALAFLAAEGGNQDAEPVQNTMYTMMKFKPYQFEEWPQAIPVLNGVVQPTPYKDNGKAHEVVIVHSQEELDALQGPGVKLVEINPDVVHSAKRVETDDDVRKELYRQAEQSGAQIDKSWPTGRIEDAIKTHVESKRTKAKATGGGEVV